MSELARKVARQPAAIASATVIVIISFVGLFASQLAPYDPGALFDQSGAGPSSDHWLGTDELGRDVLSRLMFGARVMVEAVIRALGLALVIGVPIGLLAGYRGGWFDQLVTRLVDVLFSIPGLVLALGIIAVLGPGLDSAMLAVGVGFSTRYARLTRGLVMAARRELYVDAAHVSGASTREILHHEILPNIAGPLIVQTSIFAGGVVLLEAALSFIGVGLPPNLPSWGGMLNRARAQLTIHPWLPLAPGIALSATVLSFNLLGDAVRDALARDVRTHHLTSTSAGDHVGPAQSRTPPTAPTSDDEPVLAIEDLEVTVRSPGGVEVQILDHVSLSVSRGETLGLVGESGSGKTMTALATMGLVPVGGRIRAGCIRLNGMAFDDPDHDVRAALRSHGMAMIFQEPMTALNPALTIGDQIAEPLIVHRGKTRRQARDRAIELLATVGVADPHRRAREYPHQFSGGMAQRAMIAMALANDPDLLIADEPTTALDVTVQAQILDLLRGLQDEHGMAILFITHDLGIVADFCDRAAVMYAGQVVETAAVGELFGIPRHPYTRALLEATPRHTARRPRLATIPGRVPRATEWPNGCRFQPRCRHATDDCGHGIVEFQAVDGRPVRCIRVAELEVAGGRP